MRRVTLLGAGEKNSRGKRKESSVKRLQYRKGTFKIGTERKKLLKEHSSGIPDAANREDDGTIGNRQVRV